MTRTLLCLLVCGAAASLPAQVTYLSASLDGAQQVPPVNSPGVGWAVVRYDAGPGVVRVFVHTRGLTGANLAHVHTGAVGVNGPPIVTLSGGPNDWSATQAISDANAQLLLTGNTYVNVHTAANPGGEIRGQILRPEVIRLEAALSGANEVPPNNSNATGLAVAFLHRPDDVLTYDVSSNVSSPTAAHIHVAPAGQNGPVLFPLNGPPGSNCGVTRKLTPNEVTTLLGGGMYVNVHSIAFPGGEIRGQLARVEVDLVAAMDGRQEVPPNNSQAFGQACARILADNTVSYRVTTNGLSGNAAHFHTAPAGQNGPVTVPLVGGPSVWAGTSGAVAPGDLANARNGLWYANVHTAQFPGGEIRGQLRLATLPTTYGGGCPGSNGTPPEIGADGTACIGASFRVQLSGARPGAPCALSIGASRDLFLGLPLPLDLTLVNAPGCFLLNDLVLTLGALADARGCASLTVPLPLQPSLRGGTTYQQWFVIDTSLVTSNGLSTPIQ